MNRFLVLALTAGLLSPIAANAESYWLIIVRIGSGAGVEKVQMASMAQCEKELEKIAKRWKQKVTYFACVTGK